MEVTVYKQDGGKGASIKLPEDVFAVPFNPDLVHQVVVSIQSNARAGTAHTKDRSEVSGTGKKPWRQKGTGRARHGSRRSPIWTGGGVTFGPRKDKDYSRKLNKKMRARALASVLSRKYNDEELILVEKLDMDVPKTSIAKEIIVNLANVSEKPRLQNKRKNAALLVLSERNEAIEKSFKNFGNIAVVQAKDLNPLDLLTYNYLLLSDPEPVIGVLEARVRTHNL